MDVRAVVVRVAASAVGVVLAVSLAGCSGDEEPKAGPTSEPTGTSSPPETVSTPPADETAEEFIRRWNEVQNAMQGGDTREWREMTASCAGCLETADQVDAIYKAGGYVRTNGRAVLSVARSENADSDEVFTVVIDSAPTEVLRASGGKVESLPGGRGEVEVQVTRRGGEWGFVDVWQQAE